MLTYSRSPVLTDFMNRIITVRSIHCFSHFKRAFILSSLPPFPCCLPSTGCRWSNIKSFLRTVLLALVLGVSFTTICHSWWGCSHLPGIWNWWCSANLCSSLVPEGILGLSCKFSLSSPMPSICSICIVAAMEIYLGVWLIMPAFPLQLNCEPLEARTGSLSFIFVGPFPDPQQGEHSIFHRGISPSPLTVGWRHYVGLSPC